MICFPNTNKDIAIHVIERIRVAIENKVFLYDEQEIRITASFGVSEFNKETMQEYNDFIMIADQNLYKAKQNGRNCIMG